MSESDVYRRQILRYKKAPHAEMINTSTLPFGAIDDLK